MKNLRTELSHVINSDFPIPLSLQPNIIDLIYFKQLILLDQIIKFEIQGLLRWFAKHIGIRKFEFVAQTHLLS